MSFTSFYVRANPMANLSVYIMHVEFSTNVRMHTFLVLKRIKTCGGRPCIFTINERCKKTTLTIMSVARNVGQQREGAHLQI